MLRYKRSLIRLCLVLPCPYFLFFLSFFLFFFFLSVHYPNQRITVHIIPRIHKCVPVPLCNSLIELTITNTFDPSTLLKKKEEERKKKSFHFYSWQDNDFVYVLLYAGAYFAGLKEYDAYSFLAIFFVSFYSFADGF